MEEQQAAEIPRIFENLTATNEALRKINEELVMRCAGLQQQLSEFCKEKEKLKGNEKLKEKVAAMSKQVLNEATLKDDAKKLKLGIYNTGLPSFTTLKAI